ncbi:MAG: carboxypeptidase regulatory-like domain-containing protein, partial [Kofleriaceae bacterium]
VVHRPAAEQAARGGAIAAPRTPVLPAPLAAVLEARVTRAGQPVAGVEVALADGSSEVTARTDATGIARFARPGDGPFELWAIAPELCSQLVRIADVTAVPVELALEPATTVRGAIEGAGHSAVTIELAPLDLDQAVRTVTVDDRGRFELAGVPAGHWRLAATSPGLRQTSARELAVPGRDVVVTMERAGELAGTVVDRTGAPIAGATIVVRRQGAKGLHPVEWSAPGMRWIYPFATHRQLPSNDSARFGAARYGTRLAECGAGHCGIDLVMPRGTIVHAVADGTVTVATSALSSEAGRFVAIDHGDGLVTMYMHLDHVRDGLEVGQTIRAGTALGTVGSTGFDPTRSVPHLHFALTQHRGGRTWYLDPEPGLRHAVPLPAPRALDEPVEVAAPRLAHAITTPSDEITTDARGRFRVPELDPGSYVAVAFAAGFAPGASTPVAVQASTDGVIVTLAPGLGVRGRVVGRSGPLAGATILASTGFGETSSKLASTTTDDHGEFVFHALAGTITLSTSAPGYGEASRTIELAGRDARVELSLVAEDAHLRGVVRSPFGPVAGATVRIVEGPTLRTTITNAAGELSIPVAAGHYVIDVIAPDLPPRRIAIDSDRTADIRLEQGGRAHVVVNDAHDGTALAGLRVDARGPGGVTVTRASDPRGSVDLPGLAAGTWTLAVRGPGHAPITRTMEIRASQIPVE